MRARPAFTVLEITVALALSGLVLLGLTSIVAAAGLAQTRIATEVERYREEFVNSARISNLFARANRSAADFTGAADSVSLRSRCERSGGWIAPCNVSMWLVHRSSGSSSLVLGIDGTPVLTRRLAQPGARFVFRVDGANGHVWLDAIEAGYGAPHAVALVRGSDTVTFHVGVLR